MKKPNKTKLELDRDVVERLIKLKGIGDTYSDVIKRMLDNHNASSD